MADRQRFRRGDVHMAGYAFPHEREAAAASGVEKERPVLILQNDEDNDNQRYPLALAAPITTQKTGRVYDQDVLLTAGEANLQQDSKVLLGLAQPFLKARVGRRLGRLSPPKMREVDLKLLQLFGFVRKPEA